MVVSMANRFPMPNTSPSQYNVGYVRTCNCSSCLDAQDQDEAHIPFATPLLVHLCNARFEDGHEKHLYE